MPNKVFDILNWREEKVGELSVWVHDDECKPGNVAVSAMIQIVQEADGTWEERCKRMESCDTVNPSLRTLASVKLSHADNLSRGSRELQVRYEGRNRPDFYQNMRRVILAAVLTLPKVLDNLEHRDAEAFAMFGMPIVVSTKGKQVLQENDVKVESGFLRREVLYCHELDHARGPQRWQRVFMEHSMALATCKQAEGYVVVMDLLCQPVAKRQCVRKQALEWKDLEEVPSEVKDIDSGDETAGT
jgi:hypothetical protein